MNDSDAAAADTGTLWAWVTEYPNGTIGPVAVMTSDGGNLLLTSRSWDVAIRTLKPLAADYASRTGRRVWLREYRAYLEHEEV